MKRLIFISCAIISLVVACNGEGEPLPPSSIYMRNDGLFEIPLDSSILLEPKITYDVKSTYLWLDENNNQVSTERDYTLKPQKRKDYKFTFSLTNDRGTTTKEVIVVVAKNIDCDSVDNYHFPIRNNSMLIADSIDEPLRENILFHNEIIVDSMKVWKGFVRSACSNGSRLKDELHNRGGVYIRNNSSSNKETFMAVSCIDGHEAYIEFKDQAYIVKSFDIANDFSVYATSYEDKDTITDTFLSAIEHTLTVTPLGCDKQGNVISEGDPVTLINCKGKDDRGTILYIEKWTTINTSQLGAIHGMKFRVNSNNSYIKPYFCLDNLKLQDP